MRYLLIGMTLLASITLFGKANNNKKSFKQNRVEKIKKIYAKEYDIIEKKLTKNEQEKVLPILKKYDKKILELRIKKLDFRRDNIKWNLTSKQFVENTIKSFTLRKKILNLKFRELDPKKNLNERERISINIKIINLRIKEIEELRNSGVSYNVIEKLIKFEKRFQRGLGNRMRAMGNRMRARGNKMRAKGNRMRARGNKMRAKGNKMRAKGNKMRAKGNKIRAKENKMRRGNRNRGFQRRNEAKKSRMRKDTE